MNRYGAIVMQQWGCRLPEVYAQIRDPQFFFGVLGEVIARQVDKLADELAGDRPGEGYLDWVARLFTARAVAEEIILLQWVRPEPKTGEAR